MPLLVSTHVFDVVMRCTLFDHMPSYNVSPLFQICTILFSYYIRQEHFHVADFLPIRNCLKQDTQRTQEELDFLKGSYLQPEMSADRRVWPESLSTTENDLKTPSETFHDLTNHDLTN